VGYFASFRKNEFLAEKNLTNDDTDNTDLHGWELGIGKIGPNAEAVTTKART
jgi:hypothetical protein